VHEDESGWAVLGRVTTVAQLYYYRAKLNYGMLAVVLDTHNNLSETQHESEALLQSARDYS
jgi:hypothetical protein